MFAIISKSENKILRVYEFLLEETDDYICVEIPEGITHPKAVFTEGVYSVAEDTEVAKQSAIATLKAASDKDITDAMFALFGTMNENSATRQYLTFEKMIAKPSAYVGTLFADEAAVLAYATPKVEACEAYSLFCIERTAKYNADKAILLAQ